jgi:hypothetical protein
MCWGNGSSRPCCLSHASAAETKMGGPHSWLCAHLEVLLHQIRGVPEPERPPQAPSPLPPTKLKGLHMATAAAMGVASPSSPRYRVMMLAPRDHPAANSRLRG